MKNPVVLWCAGVLGLLLAIGMVMANIIDVTGTNYLSPDKRVNWIEIGWGLIAGAVAILSFRQLARLEKQSERQDR